MTVCNTCLTDTFCISLPPEGSFSVRYTIATTGVLICKRNEINACVIYSHMGALLHMLEDGEQEPARS